MLTVYDSKNQPYVLTAKIGSGGEGTVFYCPNDAQTVAKIYHEPVTDEKAEKLRWMAANRTDYLAKSAAWITEVLTDAPGGKTVGFLMPHVKAKEIHELYSLKSRRVHFPEATWKFLIHAAANVARAFHNLHRAGHVMGDVNHGNCVVLADGTVKLIDCDSYAIKNEKSRYACEVGVATHLAPELQGKNLRGVERLFEHDNFGLAVIIFQLLFLGRHPFAGNYAGGEDKSLEECIRELRFAYSADAAARQIKQPPGTLSLASISPRLALMFERAFSITDRPQPHEWIEALEDLSHSLKPCALHPGHHFYDQLNSCPWCEIETQTGLMLFPFRSGGADGEAFNIFTVENLIAGFSVPQNLPVKNSTAEALLVPPSKNVVSARRYNNSVLALAAFAQIIIAVFFTVVFGTTAGFFFGTLTMIFLFVLITNSNRFFKRELTENLENAQQDLERLDKDWQNNEANIKFRDNLARIRSRIGEYNDLPRSSYRKLQHSRERDFQHQLNEYLSGFRVVYAEIPGIGDKRREVLREFGVKTAADIETQRLVSIPGVSSVTASKLIEWRKNLEKSFAHRPAELSLNEKESLAVEISSGRRRLEREIENLLGSMRSGSMLLRRQHQRLIAESEILIGTIAQRKSDLQAIGTNAPAAVVLLLTTFITISLGSALTNTYNVAPRREIISSSSSYPKAPSVPFAPIIKPAPVYSRETNYTVSDNLTEAQIKEMSSEERKNAAEELTYQAVQLAYTNDNLPSAERKMRLAVRLSPTDMRMLAQLAYLLSEQKKYAESNELLIRSLQIMPGDFVTKTHIGTNYLKMKKFAQAKKIFSEIVEDYPTISDSHFNLGLAYQGLRQYHQALEAFRQADEIQPQDPNTRLEIGRCFVKLNETQKAQKEYEKLLLLDFDSAEELAKLISSNTIND